MGSIVRYNTINFILPGSQIQRALNALDNGKSNMISKIVIMLLLSDIFKINIFFYYVHPRVQFSFQYKIWFMTSFISNEFSQKSRIRKN